MSSRPLRARRAASRERAYPQPPARRVPRALLVRPGRCARIRVRRRFHRRASRRALRHRRRLYRLYPERRWLSETKRPAAPAPSDVRRPERGRGTARGYRRRYAGRRVGSRRLTAWHRRHRIWCAGYRVLRLRRKTHSPRPQPRPTGLGWYPVPRRQEYGQGRRRAYRAPKRRGQSPPLGGPVCVGLDHHNQASCGRAFSHHKRRARR